MEASKPPGLEVVPYWWRRRAKAHKGEAAALKQVSHKVGVQVQLEVEHKEESSKGKAPREEAHRLRKLVVKNNKVAAEVKMIIPRVDAKAKVPR